MGCCACGSHGCGVANQHLTEQMNDRLFGCRWTAKGRKTTNETVDHRPRSGDGGVLRKWIAQLAGRAASSDPR
jgi:hypothetical protein